MPLNSLDQNYRDVATRGFLPRLTRKPRLEFLPSSVAFPKHDARKRLVPVRNNGPCIGVLKPRQDVYTGLSSIHRRILKENDREDLYTEMHAKQLLNRTLTSWQNARYLPPILLGKPTAYKSPDSFKRALERDQKVNETKTVPVATKFRNSSPLVTSEMLSINPVVLSEKPKQVSSPFSKNTHNVESSSMEEGTNQMEGRSADDKLILNEAKRNQCVGGQDSQLQGENNGSAKSTRVRFATEDSVLVFENIEM